MRKENKHCVIDIGTNSVRMLIAEYHGSSINIIKKKMEMTRIGKGVDKTKLLSERGINETLESLKRFKKEANEEKVGTIYAIATSAVRDAKNKSDFIDRCKREVGINIEVIDGYREAELGFMGILGGLKYNGNILAIDIGGGSTELIIGSSEGIKYSISIDIGAVRLTDRFITTDPITNNEFEDLKNNIQDNIRNPLQQIKKYSINKVAGIGGTITTLAAIKQNMEEYSREKIHSSILCIEDIDHMINRFMNMNNEQRKLINGLQPKRADIILTGAKILYEILENISKEEIIVSDYDNLEGFLFDNMSSKENL